MGKFRYSGEAEQRKASQRRREDAHALRDGRCWRGAMYLMGYAVECCLKAKLMKKYSQRTLGSLEQELSRRRKTKVNLRTHSVEYLFDLLDARDRRISSKGDTSLLRAFAECNTWSSEWRYDPQESTEEECVAFLKAADVFCKFIERST